MAQEFNPLRQLPDSENYGPKDTLVIFGEVFDGGYVNGVIAEAQKKSMKIIYSNVGRRNKELELCSLNSDELKEKAQTPMINVPLECGFDLAPSKSGTTPVDQLKPVKMKEWNSAKLDWTAIEESRSAGKADFQKRTRAYLDELQQHLSPEGHLVFCHTMAGGIPRAKVMMPTMNRIFKGSGDRFMSSEEFWKSELGQLCEKSFLDVTAESFQVLIDETETIRTEWTHSNKKVSYLAFGYHGCEALVNDTYLWQSYAPYLQGWAKLRLEEIASQAMSKNVNAGVFNAPEILTNSSSVFLGVEVCLYPLLFALQKEGAENHDVFAKAKELLKDDASLEDIRKMSEDYLNSDSSKSVSDFPNWPDHNHPEQMSEMKVTSAALIDLHKSSKELITKELSEIVFSATGALMLNKSWELEAPVWWVGHDIVAKHCAAQLN